MTEYAEAQETLLDTGWIDIKWGIAFHHPNTEICMAKSGVYSKDGEVSVVVYTTPIDEVYDKDFYTDFIDCTLNEFSKHLKKVFA